MNKIPARFPLVASDKISICLNHLEEMVIHLEMEFDRSPDAQRLARAFDLLLDAEPILGCRLVKGKWKFYWERLPANERPAFIQANTPAEYDAFLTDRHRPECGPQVKGCLWSDGKTHRLLLKIAHEVTDAGGCKEIAAKLGKIYRRLASEPQYYPNPNLLPRGARQVLRNLPWINFPRIYLNCLKMSRQIIKTKGFGLPIKGTFGGRPVYRRRHIPSEHVARWSEYGRQRKATLNDLMLAAYLRALAQTGGWDGATCLQAAMTIDLRRYILGGRAGAISNLSIIETVYAGGDQGHDFPDTLRTISAEMERRKANFIGLGNYIGHLPMWRLLPVSWDSALIKRFFASLVHRSGLYNSLTNMGPILPEQVTFDEPASDARLIVPPAFPPLLIVGLSGYTGSLTLTAGSYQPAATPEFLDSLFDGMMSQLPL